MRASPWAVFVEQPDGSRHRLNLRVHESQAKALEEVRRETVLRESQGKRGDRLVARQIISG